MKKFSTLILLLLAIHLTSQAQSGPCNSPTCGDEPGDPGFSTQTTRKAIYPNPSKGAFNVDLGEFSKKNVRIDIFGLSGRLISSKLVCETEGRTTVDFNIKFPHPGPYVIKITEKHASEIIKLFVVS